MNRKILHCDMNGFFASVELLDRPELRNVPVAVAGDPESRHGIVVAKNELAKKAGVVTAETVQSARRKCPDIVFLPPHHEKYRYYSQQINQVYLEYTDQVEPFSVDESWLDVTASEKLFGPAKEIADEIRRRIREMYGLTLSVGVSYNKIFAKMGSEYKKPDATTVITPENFRELLWPLPTEEFFFIGHATAEKLRAMHIYTVGELAQADPNLITRRFGVHGTELLRAVSGLDDDPVRRWDDRTDAKSVGHGMTFRRDLQGYDDVSMAVTELSDKVSSRLRRYGMKAWGVKVEITDPSFRKISRQRKLSVPVVTGQAIRQNAMELIREAGWLDRPIRLLTITAINLTREDAAEQLTIFGLMEEPAGEDAVNPKSAGADDSVSRKIRDAETKARDEKLERTMDAIRSRYGKGAIRYAHGMKNDIGIDE
ncbi:MAG: DNA polymerase IV [Mogibacterium sp.]|nr:DNA polymerase IV [Mogibacterium sp.]